MKLEKIIEGLDDAKIIGNKDIEITSISNDSRKIEKGSMFVSIKGFDRDGNEYIKGAIEKGAIAIITEKDIDLNKYNIPENVTIVLVENSRKALAIASCNFYENPSKKFTLIGITGTKGKTTTSYMLKSILQKQGKKVGLIGTIATCINDEIIKESSRTTPESIELQQTFADMLKKGVDTVIMEVSSQGLKLDRVTGCDFDIGVFTNFSEDHISPKEHPDMEDYFNSKLKLFDLCKTAFINIDDEAGKRVFKSNKCQMKTYGIKENADLKAENIEITNTYTKFNIKDEEYKAYIPGKFSVYNCLSAISVAKELGVEYKNIKEALEKVTVPGRSELVPNKKDLTIMIDYAHSPESLENILKAVKSYTKGRLISLFGCGGDRDTAKRPKMGEISGNIADYTIITSDNPRTENPEEIVKQIEIGIQKTNGKYICIVDRIEAIKHAIEIANKDDIIVLAGKGHEPYQEINGIKHPFDERIIVNEIIEKM